MNSGPRVLGVVHATVPSESFLVRMARRLHALIARATRCASTRSHTRFRAFKMRDVIAGKHMRNCRRHGTADRPILEFMRIWLDLPDDVVAQLAEQGQDLSRSALEALAIDAYRMQRLTSHQLCQLLEIPSRGELDRFLKHHGVPLEYTFQD